MTAYEIREKFLNGELTAVEIINSIFDRIDNKVEPKLILL